MTPAADDHGWWLSALYAIIGLLWAAAVTAYGVLARTLASKEYVKDAIREERDLDTERDRRLFQDLVAPMVSQMWTMEHEQSERHRQNQEKLDRILDHIDKP